MNNESTALPMATERGGRSRFKGSQSIRGRGYLQTTKYSFKGETKEMGGNVFETYDETNDNLQKPWKL